ncbi:hypothetical protein IFR05_016906, partial [Cadophora sp. M221]
MRRVTRCLVVFLLIHFCVADECDWGNTTDGSQNFKSQDELDDLAEGCTKIINVAVTVAPNYTGSLLLSGVTEISGSFSFGYRDEDSQVTSIEMPDLVSFNMTESLKILRARQLTSVSFPKLQAISGFGLEMEGAPNCQISFPSLVNSTSIKIYGGLSSMNFPLLSHIDNSLELCSVRGCGIVPVPISDVAALNVNFPSLVQVSSLKIYANILRKIRPNNTADKSALDESGLDIRQWGKLLDLGFPKLAEVTNKLDIKGNFGSISLPSLIEVPNIVNIYSYVKEVLVLPVLGTVGELYATGNMTAVYLPVLKNIGRMVLWNGPKFSSCLHEINSFYATLENSKSTSHPFKCKFEKDKEELSVGVICAICFGAVFIVGMLTTYFILWRRSQRKKAEKKKMERQAYELEQRYVAADCDSIAGTEVGSVHSEVTVVQQGIRGYVHRGAADVVR